MFGRMLLTAAILIPFASSPAQQLPPEMLWSNAQLYGVDESCQTVRITADGGYFMAGYTQLTETSSFNFYLGKTDVHGNALWHRHYGGHDDDFCWSAQLTPDSGYILAGETESYGSGGKDVWLLKANVNGDSLWSRTFGGSGDEVCYSIQNTQDGGFILAGYTTTGGSNFSDYLLIKTNANGDTLWIRTYGGTTYDTCRAVLQTDDGGYLLAGSSGTGGSSSYDFRLIRTDASGNLLWSHTYGGSNKDICNGLIKTWDDCYVMAGSTQSYGPANNNFWIVKVNAASNTIWNTAIGGSGSEVCNSVIETVDHRYLMAGWTSSFGVLEDMWLVRVGMNGDSAWTVNFGTQGLMGPNYDRCYSVQQTPDHGFILGGYMMHGEVPYRHFLLIRTSPDIMNVTVDLTPHNPPIQIPPGGGSFQFDLQLFNDNPSTSYTVDLWIVMTDPYGNPYPVLTRTNLNLPVGASILRPNLTQVVPGSAMSGTYHYTAYVADHHTYQEYDEDAFTFVKLPGGRSTGGNECWQVLGWNQDETAAATPERNDLLSVHPTPFNPVTTIGYELQASSYVTVKVFDIAGRLVTTLANGWREAGRHEAMFDGSGLPSGLYLVSLRAGSFHATEKIVLLK